MTPGSESPMQLEHVTFAYHSGKPVVDDVTASVTPGCVHALIGPNGSGKSTLVRLMLGLHMPQAGRVTFDDHPVHKLASGRRAAAISYVPQRSASAFTFSVRQVIALGRFALAKDEAAVGRAIDATELNELADEPYVTLSVGQQQRVLLARAMAQAAGAGRIMLLDEPTSAMDLSHVHRTMHQLRMMARERGMAIVIVVQDVNLAARYADRVWLMQAGRLIAAGDWADVLRAEVLEPVYGVRMRPAAGTGEHEGRPMFDVWLPAAADR